MQWSNPTQPHSTLTQLIDSTFVSGQLNRREYLKLMSAILSDSQIVDAERHEINRIFDYVQTGRLKLIDC